MKFFVFFVLLFLSIPTTTFAYHPGHHTADTTESHIAPSINIEAARAYQKAHNTGSLSDFDRLHPLIVHFPVVLLILAFVLQFVTLFARKKDLSWVVLFLIVLGFIGAYLAVNTGFHGGDPNLDSLSDIARKTFETHDKFAQYTVWISGIAALLKIISHFFINRKIWMEIIITLVMLSSVYTIQTTGEMGARLVHIDAIGVQGNQLPAEMDM